MDLHDCVEVGDHQNHQLSTVTQQRPVVLVGLGEGQTHQSVKDEGTADGQDEQIAIQVIVDHRHAEAQGHPEDDAHDHITLAFETLFEFVVIFSKGLRVEKE